MSTNEKACCQEVEGKEGHENAKSTKEVVPNSTSGGVDIRAWRTLLARRNLASSFVKESSSIEM